MLFVWSAPEAAAPSPVADADVEYRRDQDACERDTGRGRNRNDRGLGGLVGDIAGDWVGRELRGSGLSYSTRRNVRSFVSDSIACMLTPGERQAAEEATTRALEGGVGSNVGWESADRAGVSGSSSVTRERVLRSGTVCRDVTEVAIADGEEVTVIENYCLGEGGRWLKQERA
ncbi:hypothetical protein [Brevundimonas sp.]|jgi:surface antigen|uniref:hypothetical protein n=1 Tax=Brevundimonas sp. TaxID=1871086 RepID=UPI002E116685|nr:hypothetical protein [Brevundimonas sp.]